MATPFIDRAAACLQLIATGSKLRRQGDVDNAEKAFQTALLITHAPGFDPNSSEALALRSLALYHIVLLRLQKRAPEAEPLRAQAAAFLDQVGDADPLEPHLMPLYRELMANTLVMLSEFRRALPYCEASIQRQLDSNDPLTIAESMARAGKCYVRMGLRDHAVVPLREAVRMFRMLAGDPRLPSVLLDLGNAYGKSHPEEAERCYREVADYHVSRNQLESATPAWTNLAVLFNNQGRYDEALELYQRALHIREQSRGTPAERIGIVLNNISNTYRRMGQFDQALASVDRARTLLEPTGGHYFACALGTRGLALRDAGRDEEAVEWFRKSAAEHQKLPSPNLETLSEELENEAAALDRLGRKEDAADAHRRLDAVRAQMAAITAVDRASTPATPETEGAVLIELSVGGRSGIDFNPLQRRLTEAVQERRLGYYGGRVIIPETTTFMFYGDQGEAMFEALEPVLRAEPQCAGARVTVRQSGRHREISLAQRLM